MVKRIPREEIEHERFKNWIDHKYPNLLYWHTPNGGSRHPAEAAKLKRMGVKRGVPDFFFPESSAGFKGLFIEMKPPRAHRSTLSEEQRDMLRKLRSMNYYCAVAYGCQEAEEILEEYLLIADAVLYECE